MTTLSLWCSLQLPPNQLQMDFAVTYEVKLLTSPRANNEVTKHCRPTDLGRTSHQLTPASTYPWTNHELSSIADRTNFKLSSDYLQTKFDLTLTRLRTGNYLRTMIEKPSNLVRWSGEQTSNELRTNFENSANNLPRNFDNTLSQQRIKDTQDTT